ncbi:MAG: hypothetical protein NWF14_03475 [Candidatus Bathyarchaeota archaeon]|nr:hypothetical protein [Candidatus Bathyarchaeota archaeon]
MTSRKSSHNPVLGITDTETVKLNFDDTPLDVVKYWAFRTMNWFGLGGFVVFKSSEKCYPVEIDGKVVFKLSKKSYFVVFNRSVPWRKNEQIMNWVAMQAKNPNLTKYVQMQCIKEGSTLRISPEGDKPSPKIVYRYGNQDKAIQDYLEFRDQIKDIVKSRSKIVI